MARRQLHDHYFKQAKSEGYLARSAYKLKEINDAKRLIRKGDRVLDLGCAPGSWLQVAAEIVTPSGRVVGIDLERVRPAFSPNVTVLEGDIRHTDPADLLDAASPAPETPPKLFDCILSDMAPKTSGDAGGLADHFNSIELCHAILKIAPALLRPGGHLTMKVFEGEAYPDLLKQTAALFKRTKGFKPKASRDSSREIYIVAHTYLPPPANAS